MTVYQDRLFARIGTQVTARPPGYASGYAGNRLVCLDLKKEGSLRWRYPSGDRAENEFDRQRWAFEGPPLTDGKGVYVAMRRSESRAESHVACFDFQSGAMRWRRKICAADTPSHGQRNEMTHNLLTLAEGVLYLNTNLGAVVAMSAGDGAIRWVHQYPRARSGDLTEPPPHFYRDLNPCIHHQGIVIAAPGDSRYIFALDAGTGKLIWRSAPMDAHPMHLLGVGKGNLIATGKSIWWFNAVTGRADYVWPEASDRNTLRGFGRGLLAGGDIYWPTREKIYIFDQQVVIENGRRGVLQKPAIQLLRPDVDRDLQVTGGNLVVGGGMLLVAGGEQLQAFSLRKP
jgi:outer membrane protein assembly factor BamB